MSILRVCSVVVVVLACGVWFRYIRDTDIVRTPKDLNPQYDYIIVGGGSAGCVLASRLSEDPQTTVLLLEAGDAELPFSHVPGLVPFLQQTNMDWQYKTEKQNGAALGVVNQSALWPRGKVLGGTSVLNYMLHARGFPEDYNWGPEWDWNQVLPYFTKLESVTWKNSGNRGKSGPINVRKSPQTTFGQVMLQAVRALGYNVNDDNNDEPKQGFSLLELSVDEQGRRSSTANKYIRPVMNRFNLHIVKGAHVSKINFNENKQVVGVDFVFDGKGQRVLTNKEIIVSAGTINSPQILMLSGIGPKTQLQQHNVDVVAESPHVGKNLKDHLLFATLYSVNDSKAVVDGHELFNPIGFLREAYNYVVKCAGWYSWSLVELHGFVDTHTQVDPESDSKRPGQPDIQLYLFPVDVYLDGFFNYMVQLTPEDLYSTIGKGNGLPKVTFAASLLHPKSSGSIELNSANPMDKPKIDPKYLTEEIDVQRLRKGIRHIDRLAKSDHFKQFSMESLESALPACSKHQFWSDAYLDCVMRRRALTVYHPVGTCRMAHAITHGVVDQHFRVFGVEGLRVVDASIFPNTLSGNTNIPTIMVAERAAHWIKNAA